jgi:hypothetical protein
VLIASGEQTIVVPVLEAPAALAQRVKDELI